jgi:hypothetical protein
MGYMKHDSIVLTSWNEKHLIKAQRKARTLGLPTSNIVESWVNNEGAFFIAPDGSKEGWEESNKGNELRDEFKRWLKSSKLYIDWIHISFGGDNPELSRIEESSK